ncbi:MAG: hypothetical protein ACE5I9_07965 [Candidatus Methylomirabilales bacterium]
MPAAPSLEDRFQGCLLGLAIGDVVGMPFEGLPSWMVGPVLDQVQGFHESAHRGLERGQGRACRYSRLLAGRGRGVGGRSAPLPESFTRRP